MKALRLIALLLVALVQPVYSAAPAALALAQRNSVVKFHPGHYMLSNFIMTPVNLGLPGAATQLNLVGSTASFQGYMLQVSWGEIETALNTYNFADMDAMLAYLESYSPQKRFAIELIWCTPFNVNEASHGPTTGQYIPAYLTTNAAYGTSPAGGTNYGWWSNGYVNGGSYSYCAAVHRSAVTPRLTALMTALGVHYDSNPLFEGFVTQEDSGTSGNLSGAGDWSWANFNAQLVTIATAMPVAFPTSAVGIGENYNSGRSTTPAFQASIITAGGRTGFAAPDIFGQTAVTNHGTDLGRTWAQNSFIGGVYTSSWAYSGPVLNKEVPFLQNVQNPELDGTQFGSIGSPFTAGDLVTAGNTIGDQYLFWNYISSGTGNTAGVITAINMFINNLTNTSCPTTYTTGCNPY